MKKNEGYDKFALHDGPPAQWSTHLGHAQNTSAIAHQRYKAMPTFMFLVGTGAISATEHKAEQMLGTEKLNQLSTGRLEPAARWQLSR